MATFQQLLQELSSRTPNSTIAENLESVRDAHRRTVAHFAALGGRRKIMQFILEKAPEAVLWKDEEESQPLYYASKENEFAVVKLLVEHKANVNQANVDGKTALHEAAANGSVRTVKLLAEAGAHLNVQTSTGTPLHWAVSDDREKVVEILLSLKADANVVNSSGLTPLFLACLMRKHHIMELLLQANASIKAAIMGGVTVVHMSAETGNIQALELFLKLRSEETRQLINTPTDAGATPLQLAAGMSHLDIVHLLEPLTESVKADDIEHVVSKEKERAEREQLEAEAAAKAKEEAGRSLAYDVPFLEDITCPEAREVSESDQDKAREHKEAGNQAFVLKKYDEAIKSYSAAIDLHPTEPIYYSNRCAAYLAAGDAVKALYDVRVSRKLNPKWAKAIFREAQCLEALKEYEEAALLFWQVLKEAPEDKGLQNRFHGCVKRGRKDFLQSKGITEE